MGNGKKWLFVIVIAIIIAGIAVLVEESIRVKPLRADVKSLQDNLSAKEKELKAVEKTVEVAKAKMEIFVGIFAPTMAIALNETDQDTGVRLLLKWQEKVKAIGDDVLTKEYQLISRSEDSLKSSELFLTYLLQSINATLGQ
mgnify:CR=1 FL=1